MYEIAITLSVLLVAIVLFVINRVPVEIVAIGVARQPARTHSRCDPLTCRTVLRANSTPDRGCRARQPTHVADAIHSACQACP